MRRISSVWLWTFWLCACGGDAGSKSPAASGGGGSGGSSGKFSCASEVCELPATLAGQQCCADPFKGGCGVVRNGSCVVVPKPDERCPAPDLSSFASVTPDPMAMGVWVQCCASNGECGIDYGMGCTKVEDVCLFLPKALTDTLRPATCDGKPLSLPANCGTDMPIMLPGAAGSGGGA